MRIAGFNLKGVETIIALNLMVFVLEMVNVDYIIENFGLTPATILTKPWTIITSMFVHAGFSHVFFNMFALFFFGIYLTRLVGERTFLKIYFAGGIFAGLAYVFTSLVFGIPSPDIPAVGASGAIFAIMGTLVVLRPNMTILLNFLFPMPLWIFAALYTLYALFSIGLTMGSIAHNAHLGGLVLGLLVGYYLKKKTPPEVHTYGYRVYY